MLRIVLTCSVFLYFQLNGFSTLDHSDVMPHMLHSENSTQIDIVFNKLETNSTFTNSRFGMEFLLVSDQIPNNPMSIDVMKSLDDEHTPGIFEVIKKHIFISIDKSIGHIESRNYVLTKMFAGGRVENTVRGDRR